MEIVEKQIKFDDTENLFLDTYNIKDITELEEGMIFGTITSKFEMTVLSPIYEYVNGELKSCVCTYDDEVCEEFDIDVNALGGGEEVPLIFKKLDGNRAQELLSGETFIVSTSVDNVDEINDMYRTTEDFQRDVEEYSKDNIFILATALDNQDKPTNGIFAISDSFKLLYSKYTLSKKDDVISSLRFIKEQGRVHFKQKLQEYIDEVHSIAETDNVLYDYDHVEHSSRKM